MTSAGFDGMEALGGLAEILRQQGMQLPAESSMASLAQPLTVGDQVIPNRICIQPMEGFDSELDGAPTDLVRRRYGRYARSGAGLVWFESVAVAEDGKSNPHQMMLSREHLPEFHALIEEMDRISLQEFGYKQYKVLQLNHSGRVSRGSECEPKPVAARLLPSDEDGSILASDERISRFIEEMIEHALMAKEAGFDAVDVKACHGYLLSEMLSAYGREGQFGGSFENRTRALLAIVDGIRERAGDSLAITVRLNAFDKASMPEGWGLREEGGVLVPDLTEPVRLCEILREKGVRIIDISASWPGQRLFGKAEGTATPETIAGWNIPALEEAYDMLVAVSEIKSKAPGVHFVCTGLSRFRQFGAAIGSGGIRDGWFDLAGFGRMMLAYPEYAKLALAGQTPDPDKCCTQCDSCFRLMNPGFAPAGCVVRDQDPYAALYRKYVLYKDARVADRI